MTQHKVDMLLIKYEDLDNLYHATQDPVLKEERRAAKNAACGDYNAAYSEWVKESKKEIWRTNNLIIKEEND